jgi:SAM-dependent methyltransferase
MISLRLGKNQMNKKTLDTRKYWDDRLASNLNLRGTGHRAFGIEYNNALYRAQADCLEALLDRWQVDLKGKRVLDVGSGTGFYVDFYLNRGAQHLCGLDISETSVQYLSDKYPGCSFYVEDISKPALADLGEFDLVSVISVLYHVIDDALFRQAVDHLGNLCKPGGYLLISDALKGFWLPSAKHARLRRLEAYQPLLENFEIIALAPIYYFLNRSFIPVIGPKLIDLLHLGSILSRWDDRLRKRGWGNGSGMKFLLARRMS